MGLAGLAGWGLNQILELASFCKVILPCSPVKGTFAEKIMVYGLIIFISTVVCVMGFISEITVCNITHIENGRNPEAGASIFPTIPTVQILAVFIAWGLNKVHPNLGFYGILGLFVVYCLFWIPSYLKAKSKLHKLEKDINSEQKH